MPCALLDRWAPFECVAFTMPDDLRAANSVHNSVHNGPTSHSPHAAPTRTAAEVTLAVLRDVDTLAHCDFFVGSFYHSQVCAPLMTTDDH